MQCHKNGEMNSVIMRITAPAGAGSPRGDARRDVKLYEIILIITYFMLQLKL